jgi:chorismate mutase
MQKQINKIRIKIDKIDRQIIDLLETRLSYVNEVAQFKSQNNKISYIKADREYDMMVDLQKYSNRIPKEIIFQIWRNIISFSLFSEKKFQIYFTASKQEIDYATLLINNYFSYLPEVIHQQILINDSKATNILLNNVIVGSIEDQHFVEMLINYPDLNIFAKLGNKRAKVYYAAALIPEQYLVKENYLMLSEVSQQASLTKVFLFGKYHFINVHKDKSYSNTCLGTYADIDKIC